MKDLKELREEIDRADGALIRAFEERMHLAGEIAQYKAAHNRPILDKERERLLLASVDIRCEAELVPYARKLYELLLKLSRDYQRRLLEEA